MEHLAQFAGAGLDGAHTVENHRDLVGIETQAIVVRLDRQGVHDHAVHVQPVHHAMHAFVLKQGEPVSGHGAPSHQFRTAPEEPCILVEVHQYGVRPKTHLQGQGTDGCDRVVVSAEIEVHGLEAGFADGRQEPGPGSADQ